MNVYIKNFLRFIVLLLIQVIILNRVNFSGYLNPYVYVLFILMLPFETPGWLLLISAFVMGFSVDVFSNTQGLHTAASVFMAFCRPWVIRMVASPRDFEAGIQPGIHDLGFRWFFSYALILTILHHVSLFFLESFTFQEFFTTLIRVVLSTIFTVILVILSQYLFFMRKR